MLRRIGRYIAWQGKLGRAWLRGGAERHRALAHWRGGRLMRRLRRLCRERETVLFGLVEHFGDIVAAEPALRECRRRHPQARLVYVVRESLAPLVEAHPAVDELVKVRCLSEWYLSYPRAGAGAAYDLHVPGRVCDVCASVVRPTPPAEPISIADYYEHGCLLDVFARASGLRVVEPEQRRPRLHLPAGAGHAVDRLGLPQRFVVLHCRSNQAKRDWPAAKWNELAGRLRAAGVRFVEVGLEPVLAPSVADIDLTGRLDVAGTAEVIRRAAGFVGIDSGPAHVANAAGVPGVVLLGHYGRFLKRMPFSGDYSDEVNATIIQHDGPIAELPVDAAWRAVEQRLLSRRPATVAPPMKTPAPAPAASAQRP